MCDPSEADHPDNAINLVKQSPLGRLGRLAKKHELQDHWERLLGLYDWFLATTNRSTADAEAWIADRAVRREVFPKAEQFGNLMYDLLGEVARKSGTSLRYLVV